jgi:hypothetical protein
MRVEAQKGLEGCIHIHIRSGKIKAVVIHPDELLPENAVLHCAVEHVLSYKEFLDTHPDDKHEIHASGIVLD